MRLWEHAQPAQLDPVADADEEADIAFAATSLLVVVLLFVGNVLLGVAVWRSGTLPKWAGALWAFAGAGAAYHLDR